MSEQAQFLFCTCQRGAENALKAEVAGTKENLRFAYSRGGFLTFKVPQGERIAPTLGRDWVFARTRGLSLGRLDASEPAEIVAAVRRRLEEIGVGRPFSRVHVFSCDTNVPGDHGWEPHISEACFQLQERLTETLAADGICAANREPIADRGDLVLDCIEVQPHEWWLGRHTATGYASRLPGGIPQISLPAEALSRAWLKMEEALQWSRFPLLAGGRWAELGCAPGGAVQCLVWHGMEVIGVDPAALAPQITGLPGFRHIRRRSKDVRRREFRKTRWLASDMNVAPNYALDAVGDIVVHPEVQIRGMLLTLKLIDYSHASQIPHFIERISTWGFNIVRARQLCFNRQEICVAALKKPFRRGEASLPSSQDLLT